LVGYKIDVRATDVFQEPFLHDEIETLFPLNGIVVRWLIQSQAQTGPASAVTRNVNPYRLFLFRFF
jgi:hypothetical protein